ncbi:hypothetical protein C8250_024795 [Streptomyces sp. So13.3]|uniref:hypothetical protein n=1 Tax=Streptomyces TaxID=1883 RepID=UPI001106E2D8|nr:MULTISPECIES: hypothetical protein [Streptomyces]MCZ4097087.1 hypothetical protein [Streptomyces sp. H39-C1]QNA74679.1 hypothetical protein C8250_024795 [Streptomyces sp. So13.3]
MVTILGALASAALLMVAVPGSAQAATGTLTINGVDHVDPVGCFDLTPPDSSNGGSSATPDPMPVKNNTDKVVVVWDTWECNTDANDQVSTIQPGAEASVDADSSVSVE